MPRARIAHYEMCKVFKSLYEEKFSGFYCITPVDAKVAHEFWVLNGELAEEQMRPHAMNYFADEFEGWSERRWPAWLFFKHFNSFAPRIEKPTVKVGQHTHELVIHCTRCNRNHRANEDCE